MFTTVRLIIKSRLWYISSFLLIFSAVIVVAQDVYLCVWRNPERTMTKIFPDAADYATVNEKITPEVRTVIEKKLGFPLLAGQRDQFQYFRMTGKDGTAIGTIIAASQKGEYGAIEFVFGFDTSGVIKGLYVQRSRERDQSFKDRAFLDSFVGRNIGMLETPPDTVKQPLTIGKKAVVSGLRKEVVSYREVVKGKVRR